MPSLLKRKLTVMKQKTLHFERFGIGFMPITVAGWGYLFAFILITLTVVFAGRSIWLALEWQGIDVLTFAILTAGVISTVRFAHKRSA